MDHGQAGEEGVGGRGRGEGPSGEGHPALVRRHDPGRDAHERALARAVLADQSVDFPGPDVEVDAVEDFDLAEALADAPHLEQSHLFRLNESTFVRSMTNVPVSTTGGRGLTPIFRQSPVNLMRSFRRS